MTINHINLSIRWHICAKRNALPFGACHWILYCIYRFMNIFLYIHKSPNWHFKIRFLRTAPFFLSTHLAILGIIVRYCAESKEPLLLQLQFGDTWLLDWISNLTYKKSKFYILYYLIEEMSYLLHVKYEFARRWVVNAKFTIFQQKL